MTFEYEIDDHTLMLCDIDQVDDSFDHAHCTEHRLSFEIRSATIVTYIANTGFDVTEFLECQHPKFFELLKEEALEKFSRSQT